MQQFWRILAPERREVTGCLGELVDALLSGAAANIVPLLAVPLDTHRHRNVEVDLGENIEDEEEEECTKRPRTNNLPKSHWGKAARVNQHDSVDICGSDGKIKPKSLYALPSNVHNLIFDSLGEIKGVLSLSLTNRYFWAVGLTHIEDSIVSSSAPWAGERIICVSDYSDPSDFPPGLLSTDEQADLAQLVRVHHIDTFTIDKIWKKTGSRSVSQRLEDQFKRWEAKHPMSKADRTEILMGLKPEILEFYPRDQLWILRNLTTKEYVRGEVIALRESFIHGPQIDVLGFSEVLISRISWSSRPVDVGHGGNMSHGKWAGHRFDIVPLTCVDKSAGQDWTDVSDEILREMDLILTSQKGDDWRDNLSRRNQKLAPTVALGYT
ncbi:uncharacterized protein N7484_007868 [Penicillium longicatenatum]|uniref:uncharacterized protein n=1 Tax=Penicillium longicatenatum TaxID=1561947 RepID=UPI002548ED36|nr:uncharacterized protein N7484_007868 [Penicillium longicatenatum]KAJ5640006.1 hypothetical protein N7484_007868 [Penicillium longicatenatum]